MRGMEKQGRHRQRLGRSSPSDASPFHWQWLQLEQEAVGCCLLCVLPRAAFCFSPWPWICSVLVVAGDISPCPGCVEGCRN